MTEDVFAVVLLMLIRSNNQPCKYLKKISCTCIVLRVAIEKRIFVEIHPSHQQCLQKDSLGLSDTQPFEEIVVFLELQLSF